MDNFIKIAITMPSEINNEADKITFLLENNFIDIIHIRKPDWSYEKTRSLISKIPENLYFRIKIHDHYELLDEFPLRGCHLNSRNKFSSSLKGLISKSTHFLEELKETDIYEYVTLSPIFDSISKINYKSKFGELDKLAPYVKDKKVIALGGVTPEYFSALKECGFKGAAMMGFIWNSQFIKNIIYKRK